MSALPFTVKAVFDYASDHEDDLVFSIGQIITVTEEEDADWYYGTYTDEAGVKKEGLFPKNFVEKYEPPRPAARPTRHKRAEDSVTVSPAVAATPSPVPTPAAAPALPPPAPALAVSTSTPPVAAPTPVPARELATSPVSQGETRPSSSWEEARPSNAASGVSSPRPHTATPSASTSPPPILPQQTKPKPGSPVADTSTHATPAPKAAKPPPPGKPASSAFKDRIAAFNKSAAAPVTPFGMGSSPASSNFVKKSFVAPPPSKDAYVPPIQPQAPPPIIHRREETPDSQRVLKQQDHGDSDSDSVQSPQRGHAEERSEQEEEQPRTTLKERIALLQKQQLEQAARRSEAAHKKEKPKKPAKKHIEHHHEEGAVQQQHHHEETPAEAPQKQPAQEQPAAHAVPEPQGLEGVEKAEPHETVTSPVSGAADVAEEQAQAHIEAKSSETPAEHGEERVSQESQQQKKETESESGTGEDEEEEEEEDEEEIDPEIARRMAIRDRMAKMSGAMGMMGMFGGPPGGMPGMLPINPLAPPVPAGPSKKKKEHPAEQKVEEEQEPSLVSHAPPVPLPGLFAPKKEEVAKPQPPVSADESEELDREEVTSADESTQAAPPPPRHADKPPEIECAEDPRRHAPPPPPLETRPPPPPAHGEAPVPMSPREPPPMPPNASRALSVGSSSEDDTFGAKGGDSFSERGAPHEKPASISEAISPVEAKSYSRPPPPVPEVPAPAASYSLPTHQLPKRRSSTFTPTIQTVVSDDESAAYEGDYDTDAGTAARRDGAHHVSHENREGIVSSPTSMYDHRPPPVPTGPPPPRAAPPPPVPFAAPPPPRHSPAPPPPSQPPMRLSMDVSRPPPVPPTFQQMVSEEHEDAEFGGRDYDSHHHHAGPGPGQTYDVSSSVSYASPTHEGSEGEYFASKPQCANLTILRLPHHRTSG